MTFLIVLLHRLYKLYLKDIVYIWPLSFESHRCGLRERTFLCCICSLYFVTLFNVLKGKNSRRGGHHSFYFKSTEVTHISKNLQVAQTSGVKIRLLQQLKF